MVDIEFHTETEIARAVRDLLDRSWTAERRVAAQHADGFDKQLWRLAVEQGWFALAVPESRDGLAHHPSELAPIFRLFGERLVSGPFIEQMLLPGLVLAEAGARDSRIFERLASAPSGETRVALVDQGATTQWAGINGELTATNGKINGSLELVRFGSEADEFIVIASNGAALDVILIDCARQGVDVAKRSSIDPGSSYAGVSFHDVAFENDEIIASGIDGTKFANSIRSWFRILIAHELAGISRHMLNQSVEYLGNREQFGHAIGKFQAMKHIAATVAQRGILMENFCEAVAADSRLLGTTELSLASMTLKANTAEAARLVCEDALQMHGGIAFTYEYELHWYYKRALALRSWFGDERELSVEIGRSLLNS